MYLYSTYTGISKPPPVTLAKFFSNLGLMAFLKKMEEKNFYLVLKSYKDINLVDTKPKNIKFLDNFKKIPF